MAYFITFLISFLTLIDYNYGLNCYYCLPCSGTNARLVTCAPDKNFCSILKGTDPTGEEKTVRRCETSTDAVSGTCYSNGTYEEYTNVQACLCNTDGCNFDYSTLTKTTTSQSGTSTSATTTTTTTTTTTSKAIAPTQPSFVPSGGMGPTTLLGATQSPLLTFPSNLQTPSATKGAVMQTNYAITLDVTYRLTTWLNQLTEFGDPPSDTTKSSTTTQTNFSKASNHSQGQWLTMIVLLLSSVTFKFM